MRHSGMLGSIILLVAATSICLCGGPRTISYQGFLAAPDGNPVPDGTYAITAKLYPQLTGGTALWQESLPTSVHAGVFSVILGKVTPLTLPFDVPYALGITVGTGPELTPRTELTSAAYSFHAAAIGDSSVTARTIVNGQLVRSLNGIKDDVRLIPGSNISITVRGDSLVVDATASGLALPFTGSSSSNDTTSLLQIGNSGSGRAISGISTSNVALASVGVYGRTGSAGLFSAGVRGENTNSGGGGIGVMGSHAGGGIGMYGYSLSGIGVDGISISGPGISATTTDGTGVEVRSNGTGDIFRGLKGAAEVFKINQNGKVLMTPNPAGGASSFTIRNDASADAIEITQTGTGHSLKVDQSGAGSAVAVDVTNTSGVGLSLTTSSTGKALNIVGSTTGSITDFVNIERTANPPGFDNLLLLKSPATSSPFMLYIAAMSGNDDKFAIQGDGDVYADGVFVGGGADFAELVEVDAASRRAETGDVMVASPGKDRAMEVSSGPRSTTVIGICSTKPGFLGSERSWDIPVAGSERPRILGREEMREMYNEVPLAVVGIVPCKVTAENGPIHRGDLLVTSSTPGHAMRDDDPKNGTIVGKALGVLDAGTGVINVLVTLQ